MAITRAATPAVCEAWIDGFLTALEAAAMPADARAELLAKAMPEPIRDHMIKDEIRQTIQRMVADGRYIRLTNGGLVKADEYDPKKHGEANPCGTCGKGSFRCMTLKELGDQEDSGERCCDHCHHEPCADCNDF